MADSSIFRLQNGSDIRGVAMPGVAGEAVNLTEARAIAIGRAFARWLKERLGREHGLVVALGRDSRLTGTAILGAVAGGLAAEGVDVLDLGLATTPAMFMTTIAREPAADGAVMITASHLPFNRNGMKFFTAAGGLDKADIRSILETTERLDDVVVPVGTIRAYDFMPRYAEHMADKIRAEAGAGEKPLTGFHIVVDAGNGAGGFFAADVLEALGADTSGSQFLEPDGTFPNHVPNPENEEAMAAIVDAVRRNNADLGIIFDTDVDRSSVVDADGTPIHRNRLIALIAAILLRDHPGTTIVTDSITSDELSSFIAAKGGIHHRFKRGYRNVINEAVRLNDAGRDSQLAIETSGHGALKENYFLDDGAYLAAKILAELVRARKAGRKLADAIASLREPLESEEVRFHIGAADFAPAGQAILDGFARGMAALPGFSVVPDNYEGVRVAADAAHGDGWCLLRLSLHDPVMPLNLESRVEGGVRTIAGAVRTVLDTLGGLDLTPLERLL